MTTGSGYAKVTYPVNRFTQRPVLGLTVRSTSTNNVGVPWQEQGSATAASFKVIIFTIGGAVSAGQVEWSARQMTPTSAQG